MQNVLNVDIPNNTKNVKVDCDKLANEGGAHNLIHPVIVNEKNAQFEIQVQNSNVSDDISENTMGKQDEKKSSHVNTSFRIYEISTNVAHVCMTCYMFLVIYLCFNAEFTFFTWHPLLLSIGYLFLMTEGILSLSGYNVLSRSFSRLVKLRIHWIGLGLGAALATIGMIVVIVNKNSLNKPHFKSWHSIFGLASFLCYLLGCLNGTAVFYPSIHKKYITPKLNKLLHVACGASSFALGGISLILTVYTKWFGKHTDHSALVFYFSFILVLTGFSMALIKPSQAVYKKSIKFFFPPK